MTSSKDRGARGRRNARPERKKGKNKKGEEFLL